MIRPAEVTPHEWIAAPVDTVRAQFERRLRLPLPPVIGSLVPPSPEARIRKEVRAASLEDKQDTEARGYPDARPALAAA